MALRARRHPSILPMLAVVTLLVSACDAACVQPPCPLPTAITVTVTSSVTGDSVPGAFVQMNAQSGPGGRLPPADLASRDCATPERPRISS